MISPILTELTTVQLSRVTGICIKLVFLATRRKTKKLSGLLQEPTNSLGCGCFCFFRGGGRIRHKKTISTFSLGRKWCAIVNSSSKQGVYFTHGSFTPATLASYTLRFTAWASCSVLTDVLGAKSSLTRVAAEAGRSSTEVMAFQTFVKRNPRHTMRGRAASMDKIPCVSLKSFASTGKCWDANVRSSSVWPFQSQRWWTSSDVLFCACLRNSVELRENLSTNQAFM